jgi:hypothetical protein
LSPSVPGMTKQDRALAPITRSILHLLRAVDAKAMADNFRVAHLVGVG